MILSIGIGLATIGYFIAMLLSGIISSAGFYEGGPFWMIAGIGPIVNGLLFYFVVYSVAKHFAKPHGQM
jgi:hypothetical protein